MKKKIHKPENKNNPLGFYENNIKDFSFSQDIFNDEQDQKSEGFQELTPDQPFSPHPSSSVFSLTGTKTSEEIGHLEDIWSFRMEHKNFLLRTGELSFCDEKRPQFKPC